MLLAAKESNPHSPVRLANIGVGRTSQLFAPFARAFNVPRRPCLAFRSGHFVADTPLTQSAHRQNGLPFPWRAQVRLAFPTPGRSQQPSGLKPRPIGNSTRGNGAEHGSGSASTIKAHLWRETDVALNRYRGSAALTVKREQARSATWSLFYFFPNDSDHTHLSVGRGRSRTCSVD